MSLSLHFNIRMNIILICIRISDSVRLSIIANLYLTFDLYSYANSFVFVSGSMVVLVLVQILVLMSIDTSISIHIGSPY